MLHRKTSNSLQKGISLRLINKKESTTGKVDIVPLIFHAVRQFLDIIKD